MTELGDSARLARMEGKLDTALDAHSRRIDAADAHGRRLHDRLDNAETSARDAHGRISGLATGMKAIVTLVTLSIAAAGVWAAL